MVKAQNIVLPIYQVFFLFACCWLAISKTGNSVNNDSLSVLAVVLLSIADRFLNICFSNVDVAVLQV
jgi:hypothetical protein